MKSRVRVGTHPLHPMIVPFPIAFLTGSVVFDAMSRVVPSEPLYHTAGHCMIAGVVTGLFAALPGFIDFTTVIPGDTRAKKRAVYHLSVNTLALIAFLVSLFARPTFAERNILSILPAYAGFLCLTIGGWLGSALVYEDKIGIEEKVVREPDLVRTPWERAQGEMGAYPHH